MRYIKNNKSCTMWLGLIIPMVVIFPGITFGQATYTDRVSNYLDFLYLYNRVVSGINIPTIDIIPKQDLSVGPMAVNISLVLHTLFDFDELGGTLEMAASVKLSWYDELIQIYNTTLNYSVYRLSNVSTYNSLLVRYDRMWTPKLVLGNSADQFSRIGDIAYMCRYDLTTGLVTWQPKFLLKTTCSADVTYYPFDKQDCTFTILSWGYTSNEVMLNSTHTTWDTSAYEGNGEWEVVDTGSTSYVASQQSVFELRISLKRNPLYFAFNIIIPVLALSFLNGAVFWLPVESGERVGFSITCFLTFMVLLATILGYLPPSSSNMSYLCYYVVVMMLFSGLVTTFVVLNLYIYHKDENGSVPCCLNAFMRFWRNCYRCLKCERHAEHHQNSNASTRVIEIQEEPTPGKSKVILSGTMLKKLETNSDKSSEKEAWRESDGKERDKPVTWKDFSKFLDMFLFVAFLSAEGFFSVTFLVPLAYRA